MSRYTLNIPAYALSYAMGWAELATIVQIPSNVPMQITHGVNPASPVDYYFTEILNEDGDELLWGIDCARKCPGTGKNVDKDTYLAFWTGLLHGCRRYGAQEEELSVIEQVTEYIKADVPYGMNETPDEDPGDYLIGSDGDRFYYR